METNNQSENKSRRFPFGSLALSAALITGAVLYSNTITSSPPMDKADQLTATEIVAEAFDLPINWGDIGAQMIAAGVINRENFEMIYDNRGGLTEEMKVMLYGKSSEPIQMSRENAGFLLNLLWGFGLGNKNPILEDGPMVTYDGKKPSSSAEALVKAGNFASTGGWTIAKGDAMNHYSAHRFIELTPDQQSLVERVSKNIYRPCCGNSTYFPDCNHGMAMLGLLELMAANNASEEEIYRVALKVNSLWFPDTYATIASYLEQNGSSFDAANPKDLLGKEFSSASGYSNIVNQVKKPAIPSGGGCSV